MSEHKNISVFSTLFKARNDVFALRWEKAGKSGYSPAYQYDLYRYKLHRMKGGTFQNYADKSYIPFTEEQITKHLVGEQFIGIYPLLKDNTSWFIAADFDGENWINECRTFLEICKHKKFLLILSVQDQVMADMSGYFLSKTTQQ